MHLSKTAIKSKGHTCYKKARFKLLKFIILILLFQIKPVFAKDYISERAYFEDKTGNLSFQEVKGKNFKKIDSVLAKGYSDSAFWLRLKINPLVKSNFKSNLSKMLGMGDGSNMPSYVEGKGNDIFTKRKVTKEMHLQAIQKLFEGLSKSKPIKRTTKIIKKEKNPNFEPIINEKND